MASEPRLTSEFWVDAYRNRLDFFNIPVFLRKRGDATAGVVLIKLNTLDGQAKLFQRGFAIEGPRGWEVLVQGPDRDVEDAIEKQSRFDRDLWVLEIESSNGETLLDEPGLSD